MVTSVNGNTLAALQAREQAQAGRTTTPQTSQAGAAGAASRDPAVVYAGSAEGPTLSAILSVQDSLNRAAATSDLGLGAGQTISQLLGSLRETATSAQNASPDQQAGLNADYQQLLQAIDQIAGSAKFQGVSLLDGSTGDLSFKVDATGEAMLTLPGQDFTVAGLGLAGTGITGSPDEVGGVLGRLGGATSALTAQLAQMGALSNQIQGHLTVLGQLQSALAGGGPADLDADGARLQALQIQQTLSGQGMSIASQAPQTLLSLFRSA